MLDFNLVLLDSNFKILEYITNYKSLLWADRFYNIGDCELHLLEINPSILNKTKYIYFSKSDSYMKVYYSQIDNLGIVIKAYSLDSILKDRFSYENKILSGSAEDILHTIVNNNCILKNKIPRLKLGTSLSRGNQVEIETLGQNVYENLIAPLLEENELSVKCNYNSSDNSIIFEVVKGENRTQGSSNIDRWVVLSKNNGNIFSERTSFDEEYYKNYAYVYNSNRTIFEVINNSSGKERKDIFIDFSEKDKDATVIDVRKLMQQAGKSELEKLSIRENIEIGIDTSKISDLKIGDYITYRNDNYNLITNSQIIEKTYVYEENKIEMHFSLGKNKIKLLDIIKMRK